MFQEGTNSHTFAQTPTTLMFQEAINSHTFDQTPMAPMSQEAINSHTFDQVTVSACQVLLGALPYKTSESTIRAQGI
jgi:hypothetical protein